MIQVVFVVICLSCVSPQDSVSGPDVGFAHRFLLPVYPGVVGFATARSEAGAQHNGERRISGSRRTAGAQKRRKQQL